MASLGSELVPKLPHVDFFVDRLRVKINIRLSADLNKLSDVVDGVVAMLKAMDCGCGKELELQISLREALANAIIHGCKNDSSKQVQCTVACDEGRGLLIVIRDPGEGFDPRKVANPLVGQNIFSDHGRGVFLINELVDKVKYEKGGTEIHMHLQSEVCTGYDIQ
jgi:serine/threonine-protein kinase RsbW